MHLQDQHTVLFNEAEASTALSRSQDTKLTAYFNLVREGWRVEGRKTSENGGPLFYAGVPRWYTREQKTRSWKPRLRRRREDQAVIGRLFSVAPKDLDRFYLRLLLLHTPDATGYVGTDALKPTAETTWRAAAEQRGLVETDEEFNLLLCEASLTHLPRSLRDLFVQVLIHGEPSEPQKLWETYAGDLSQDYMRQALTPAAGLDAALHAIDLLLQSHGKKTTDFGLPEPSVFDAAVFQNRALRQAMDFDVSQAETAAAE